MTSNSTAPQKYDFSGVPDGTIHEFHRQAEEYLRSTVDIAIAADSRATTLSGIFGGGGVALLAAAATILAIPSPSTYAALFWSMLVGAIFLLLAALASAFACRPIDFHVVGYEPKRLFKAATDETWMLRCATEDMQARIDANRASLERQAKILNVGMGLAFAGLIISVAVFLGTRS